MPTRRGLSISPGRLPTQVGTVSSNRLRIMHNKETQFPSPKHLVLHGETRFHSDRGKLMLAIQAVVSMSQLQCTVRELVS
jgi:hypothetical protein